MSTDGRIIQSHRCRHRAVVLIFCAQTEQTQRVLQELQSKIAELEDELQEQERFLAKVDREETRVKQEAIEGVGIRRIDLGFARKDPQDRVKHTLLRRQQQGSRSFGGMTTLRLVGTIIMTTLGLLRPKTVIQQALLRTI